MKKIILFVSSLIFISILVLMGLFKINVINTSKLSLDNYDSKYVSIMEDDTKKEYLNFINDKSYVKIYDEDEGYRIKLGENEIHLRNSSKIVNYIKNFFGKIESLF